MYQAFPGGNEEPVQADRSLSSIPQSVARAVQVMYVGAVASLVGIVIDLLSRHSLRTYIADHTTRNGKKLTATQVTNTYHAELAVLVIVGLIGVALWIWMARSNRAGKNWARIVSTVFFAIDTIGALLGLADGALAGGSATRIYGIVVWLIGLVAIILLWQRASSHYFKSAQRL